jgi:hypothetical protein
MQLRFVAALFEWGRVIPIFMPRPVDLKDWQLEAVQLMARDGCSLQQAATILGERISVEEANRIIKKLSFQELLWEARHRYFGELGANPNWNKQAAIGKLLDLARKLDEDGQFDKAAEVVFKIAKMSDWVGPESTVNVFGELSQADMDDIRAKVSQNTKVKVN